ncbi:carboxymuconolactone decarboxylase family protein [Jiangella aurantiaca]|uniref:carboxymuconolactone decarboxylase family protein n=1 Tax=Jiangella aurantiaca TaxID=2530373 RepID=UPI001EF107DA|nr:carboxymuconolactone decarboxylase family protein [Jiangella aurantiaca]
MHDEQFIESVLGIRLENIGASKLDPKTRALVQLGALLAVDAGAPSYQWIVDAAFASGATVEEIAGAVIAVAPTVGVERLVSAAPKLGLAVGYDVDAALERLDDDGEIG